MGVYIRMLERYMRFRRAVLIRSLTEAGIAADLAPCRVFVDGSVTPV